MDANKIPIAMGLAFKQAPPQSIDTGTSFSFSVVPKWPEAMEYQSTTYRITEGGKAIQSGELPSSEADDGSIVFALNAPGQVGEHRWLLSIVRQGRKQDERAEGTLPLTLKTIPHETSLAVWDNPSPVVRGTRFEVKIGAKCTASCGLGERNVEIRDESAKIMGSGTLRDTTWPGTQSLYWTSVSLKAPRKLGPHSWTVSFSPSELELAHGAASSRFSFITVGEPEHSVSVKVVNKETKAPIGGAQVRVGLYRTMTNEKGAAKVHVPKGTFELVVTRAGYEMSERSIFVSQDIRVQVGAEQLPEEDPFAIWTA
jgi:hypothetical protein